MTGALIVLLVVAALVLLTLARTIRIVPQARAGVVERLGRYSRTLTPGLTIVTSSRRLYAATHGMGMWYLTLPSGKHDSEPQN